MLSAATHRAKHHGLDMAHMIGFAPDSAEEYKSRHAIHMDAFRYVVRNRCSC